jgi:hypothetical protein
VDIVVLKQTARVAQVGCGQVLCERAVVVCLVSRVGLCSSVRGKDGLLRRREGVDRSEGGAGFAGGVAHGLWRAWCRGRAVNYVAGRVNPQNDLSSRESRPSCCPIRHQPWSGRPALPWQCSGRDAQLPTLRHAITRPAIGLSQASPLPCAHCGCTPDKAMRIRRPSDETRSTAMPRCAETVRRNSICLSMSKGTSNAAAALLEDQGCTAIVLVSTNCPTVRHEHDEALARQQAVDRADLREAPTVLREATVDPPPAVSPAYA